MDYKPQKSPRCQPMPQTIATWKELGNLYEIAFEKQRIINNRLNNTNNGLQQKAEKLRLENKDLRDAAKKVASPDDLLKRNNMLLGELCAASSLIADLQSKLGHQK